jgi:hypothetical protein
MTTVVFAEAAGESGAVAQASREAVTVKTLELLLARLQRHEPEQHQKAEELLSTGTLPNLLYCTESHGTNLTVLCCMHACCTVKKQVYLPEPRRDAAPTGTGVEAVEQDLGEDRWLFDADQPYLAEVFMNGQVPGSRLPHLDRSIMKGRHVARVLGRSRHHIKVLRENSTMFLYTPWCGTKTS